MRVYDVIRLSFSGGLRGNCKVDSDVPLLEMEQAAVTCRFVIMVPLLSNLVYHNSIMFDLADITIRYNTIQKCFHMIQEKLDILTDLIGDNLDNLFCSSKKRWGWAGQSSAKAGARDKA